MLIETRTGGPTEGPTTDTPTSDTPTSLWARARTNQWSALPVLMAGTAMIVLDFFIVNVALPSMQAHLHAGPAAIEWIVAGYGLAFSIFLITAGRIGDQIGRRRLLAIGLALFGLSSAGCGLAPDAGVLVAFRVAQGVAGALISPTVLSIIGVLYTGEQRVRAISIYGIVMGIAAAGGQLIGGLLIQANVLGLGWRAIFLINIPIGAAALALTPYLIPESKSDPTPHLDLEGTALLTVGLTAIVLPLVEGRRLGWPAWTWASLAAGPLVLALFVAHQTRRAGDPTRTPLLDVRLFKSRAFSAGLATQLGLWAGQASFFLVLALYLQQGKGLDPLEAGLVFTILAGAYLLTSLRAPALTIRYGRSLITGGALTLAAGHGMLLAASQHSIGALVPGLLLAGAGMGLCITPLTTTLMASAGPEHAGAVSGAMSTMQQLGNSLGVAVTGVIFFGTVHHGYAHAFGLSVLELAALLVGVAGLSRMMPAQKGYFAPMSVLITIGDFSRMTHLSVKALRHYHDVGLLEPAEVDRSSGYRLYEPSQVPTAQVIRRFRDLGMPVDEVKAVLAARDLETRNKVIVAHLERMEEQLEQTKSTVTSLRTVLEAPAAPASVTFRSMGATHALAIRQMVTSAEMESWWFGAFTELRKAIENPGVARIGPDACLYPAEMFELEEGEMVAYAAITGHPECSGRVMTEDIPACELAIIIHEGGYDTLDIAYGALGTFVTERAIGVEGPIREHYLVGPSDTDVVEEWRTEVCWPVFRTAG